MKRVVLCADSESVCHPELIGLDGENLEVQPWLSVFTNAEEARAYVRKAPAISEVWVASTDDVAAINLAAALHIDDAQRRVYLVLFDASGSILSRARAAGVAGTLTKQGLAQRFALEKRRAVDAVGVDARLRELEGEGGGKDDGPDDLPAAAVADVEAGAGEGAGRGAGAYAGANADAGVADGADADALEASSQLSEALQSVGFASRAVDFSSQSTGRESRAKSAFLLPVVSGSGGTGKSTVAVLAAYLAHARGLRTLLLDYDLQFGDVRYLTGAKKALSIDELLEAPSVDELVDELADDATAAPALLAAPARLEQAEAVAAHLPQLLDSLTTRFDVIVANTGASWAEHHAVLLERSTCVLFLVDQRAASVRTCRHALELCMRCGIATGSFVYAVNRCRRGAFITSIDVSCALQGAHVVELKYGGVEVEELMGAGMAEDLSLSHNELCLSLSRVLDDILPQKGSAAKSGEDSGLPDKRQRSRRRSRRETRNADSRRFERKVFVDAHVLDGDAAVADQRLRA